MPYAHLRPFVGCRGSLWKFICVCACTFVCVLGCVCVVRVCVLCCIDECFRARIEYTHSCRIYHINNGQTKFKQSKNSYSAQPGTAAVPTTQPPGRPAACASCPAQQNLRTTSIPKRRQKRTTITNQQCPYACRGMYRNLPQHLYIRARNPGQLLRG